jgi:hypothetical protein
MNEVINDQNNLSKTFQPMWEVDASVIAEFKGYHKFSYTKQYNQKDHSNDYMIIGQNNESEIIAASTCAEALTKTKFSEPKKIIMLKNLNVVFVEPHELESKDSTQ